MLKLNCFVISNEQMHLPPDLLISCAFPAEIANSHQSLTFFKMLKKGLNRLFCF